MADLSTICGPIARELAAARKATSEALEAAAAIAGARGAVDAGDAGKQLRPAVLLLVARLFRAEAKTAVRLAATVELVHAASLIHDDVIDDAGFRRGRPTTASRIGASDAVLLGDVIFTAAFSSVVALGQDGFTRELARAAREVCAGEVRQSRVKGNFSLSRAQYTRIVELKTASLYRACGVLGALAGGASKKQAAAAGRFGHYLGLGFQAADDLLDFAGDPRRTGKPPGQDLAQGKMTLPAIIHIERLRPAARRRARLRLAAGDAKFHEDFISKLRARGAGIVRPVARRYCRAAIGELGGLPDGPEKKCLAALCRFAVTRSY